MRAGIRTPDAPPRRAVLLDRTFETVVFDWDGTAVPDRDADASPVRQRIEALCSLGVDCAVVSGTHVGNIDGQLHARPRGPGRLYLCVNRGSEVFVVGEQEPALVARRDATEAEDRALDAAAAATIAALEARGLTVALVSQRLNRRKIDLIPEPDWADPPKARLPELLAAVLDRLRGVGMTDLAAAVALAEECARDAGLIAPRVTSDAKHVEIGLTDKSDAATWLRERQREQGVTGGLILVVGDEFGSLGGVAGSDALLAGVGDGRAAVVSVGPEPSGAPAGVRVLGGGPATFLALLDEQIERRRCRRVPATDEDPGWTVAFPDGDPALVRVQESILCLADGCIGTRGALEEDGPGATPGVLALGVYDDGDRLLPGPWWTALEVAAGPPGRRVLDLRTGVLTRQRNGPEGELRTARFQSRARPGIAALRGEGPSLGPGEDLIVPPDAAKGTRRGVDDDVIWVQTTSGHGGITAAARSRVTPGAGRVVVERIAAYATHPDQVPHPATASGRLRDAEGPGFDALLREHRAWWARRWADAHVSIDGNPSAERAVRFALFHLLATVPDRGEAAVGARGLSGPAYAGHVFWDADVYVLPVLAAVHPAAARAMLDYRVRRLPEARRIAETAGRRGARYPWESAGSGQDVTPRTVMGADGRPVVVRTGTREDHIAADVAWAARRYVDWTGDREFEREGGGDILVEAARFWASRIRWNRDRAHIWGVIGPDEYHEVVDDNAYTNVMARWTLRLAADLAARRSDVDDAERDAWRRIASALVDGYDERTGRYEQFAGFSLLEPLIVSEAAEVPIAADLLWGRERVQQSQVIKQADVLMLHFLVPEAVAPHSLEPNLDYYFPRTAHGSSLSPAVHAALLARAGRLEDAVSMFQVAATLDLEDLTGTTAAGLHFATFGGLWQALVHGFLGFQLRGEEPTMDPHLPADWGRVEVRCVYRGRRLGLRAEGRVGEVVDLGPYVPEPSPRTARERTHDEHVAGGA